MFAVDFGLDVGVVVVVVGGGAVDVDAGGENDDDGDVVAVGVVARSELGFLLGPWCTPMVGEGGGPAPWRKRPERPVGSATEIARGSSAAARWSPKARVGVSSRK